MGNKVKKLVTLTNGEVAQINYDTIQCPMCLNGRMFVKNVLADEWMVMECPTCRTQVHVPFISITEEPIEHEEEPLDE